jgi:hypothetical protein
MVPYTQCKTHDSGSSSSSSSSSVRQQQISCGTAMLNTSADDAILGMLMFAGKCCASICLDATGSSSVLQRASMLLPASYSSILHPEKLPSELPSELPSALQWLLPMSLNQFVVTNLSCLWPIRPGAPGVEADEQQQWQAPQPSVQQGLVG